MPARALDHLEDQQALRDLADAIGRMEPLERARFIRGLLPQQRMVVERAVAIRWQAGWRANPATFAHHLDPKGFQLYKHVEYLSQKFVDAIEGRSPRQLWNLPGRYTKTTVLRWGLAWGFDRMPASRWIWSTYGDALALESGYVILNILRAHADHVRVQLSPDRKARDRFTTTGGGGLLAAGIDTAITGFGCGDGGGLILDDPFKPLAADTPIPTPAGWTTMGALQVGDVVFDHAGQPCNVTALTERWEAPRHRVKFSDGTYIDAHPAHRWRALNRADQAVYSGTHKAYGHDWWKWTNRGKSQTREVTTTEIMDSLNARVTMRNWTIPNAGPLQTAPADLPLDPYVFGYWLGDGTAREPRLTVGADDLPALRKMVEVAGYHVRSERPMNEAATCFDVGISLTMERPNRHGPSFARCLRDLGLVDAGRKSLGKHVPTVYLRASAAQRLALLQGLMDSDGTVGNGQCVFVTMTPALAEGVAELVASLGGKATVRHYPSAIHVAFAPPFQPFALERKADKWNPTGQIRRHCRTITAVDVLEETEHLCITVDSDSHMFLAGRGMVPTCNSWQEAHSEANRERVLNQYLGTLRNRLDSEDAPIIIAHHRMHEEDPTGKLVALGQAGDGDQWEVVSLPALAIEGQDDPLGREPGEPLWPERFPLEAVKARHIALGSYLSSALEQQSPQPEEGNDIKRAWFKLVSGLPPRYDDALSSWDMKLKDKESGDFVVGGVWGRLSAELYRLDEYRGQWDQATVANAIALVQVRYPWVKRHIVENTGNGPEVMAGLRKAEPGYIVTDEVAAKLGMTEWEREQVQILRRRGMQGILPENPKGDKRIRMRAQSPIIEAGHVHLLETAPWLAGYLDEMAAFPKGKYDDRCLAAETLVERPDGPCRIDEVEAGDRVAGLTGWVDVLAAGQTAVAETHERFGLRATANHPIWTDRGWVEFLEVKNDDSLWVWDAPSQNVTGKPRQRDFACAATSGSGGYGKGSNEGSVSVRPVAVWMAARARHEQAAGASSTTPDGRNMVTRSTSRRPSVGRSGLRRSTSMGSRSGVIPTRTRLRIAAITSRLATGSSAAFRRSTRRSGRPLTVRSQTVGMSTTLTEITPTTTPRTWSLCRGKTTTRSTANNDQSSVVARRSWLTWIGSARWPRSGMARLKDGLGMWNTPSGSPSTTTRLTASTATSTRPRTRVVPPTAPARAGNATEHDHARPTVVPVFNLTTSDGTFFANGVLVHNCDETSQALKRLAQGGAAFETPPAQSTPSAPSSPAIPRRPAAGGMAVPGRRRVGLSHPIPE